MKEGKGNKSARTSIRISAETLFSLRTCALLTGKSHDEIVDAAIRTYVSDRVSGEELERLRAMAERATKENDPRTTATGRKGGSGAVQATVRPRS